VTDSSAPAERLTDPCRLGPLELLGFARAHGGRVKIDGLGIRLAGAFGFCQGVERAVELALQAAARSDRASSCGPAPPSRLFVTGEIIHNPAINEQLRRAGVVFLSPAGTPERFAGIRASDRVIIPAFGITRGEEDELRQIGCAVIDTTCGWVRRVWRAAREFAGAGLTIVIHGRLQHEETRATASRVDGPWIVVRDRGEAERLARAVSGHTDSDGGLGPGLADAFREEFGGSASPGFDPTRDLDRLGVVNQTTMLSSETKEIAAILRATLEQRWGGPQGPDRFRTLDTFCPATQERQDAVRQLLARGDLDLLIVVGGFHSSNTAHLARLGAGRVPSFHVEDASCLIDRERIRHLPPEATDPALHRAWLPAGPCTIGVSAGASTPDLETGLLLQRLIELQTGRACGGPHRAAGPSVRPGGDP
jgi:4-hydroxy-3-methylbut-2-enyl diphosphate reductase